MGLLEGRLRLVRVLAKGRELARRPLPAPFPWVPLSPHEAAARSAAARGEDVDLPALLVHPSDLAPPPLVRGAAEDGAAYRSLRSIDR
jgi:hypothetical protein